VKAIITNVRISKCIDEHLCPKNVITEMYVYPTIAQENCTKVNTNP